MEQAEQSEEKLTKEQIAERKLQMMAFYKEQVPFLEEQIKYERLITEIEECHTRQVQAQMRMAQMMAPPAKEDGPDPEKARTLKKD